MSVYLDYAATTPVDPRVLRTMLPYFTDHPGNASSMHAFGQEARAAVDGARVEVASLLGARPGEIVFTSGATEADNLAVVGAALAAAKGGDAGRGRHVITSAIEHHAIHEACHFLQKREFEITVV